MRYNTSLDKPETLSHVKQLSNIEHLVIIRRYIYTEMEYDTYILFKLQALQQQELSTSQTGARR